MGTALSEVIDMSSKVKLNSLQRLILRIRGDVFIGKFKLSGWTGETSFYAFKCPTNPEHGIVVSYISGYESILACPLCLKKEEEDTQVKK